MIFIKKEIFKEFNNYVKKYNLKDEKIMDKFHHTYRVVEYSKKIGKSLNLNDNDFNLLVICALLHDIARFKQIAEYNTFCDYESFDHGDKGYEILKEENFIDKFTKNMEEQEIILFSVKNHNKKEIENGTEKQILFSKIVRDADKLDIMMEQGNIIRENNLEINPIILEEIKNNQLCSNINVINEADSIIRILSFISDINFDKTFEFILKNNIIENKINLLRIYTTNNNLDKIQEHLLKYIKER